MPKPDVREKRLQESVDRGEWRAVSGAAVLKAHYQRLAAGHLKKEAKINVRLSRLDLEGLRRRAAEEGLPYQTLISSLLHKYVSGRLVEKLARG